MPHRFKPLAWRISFASALIVTVPLLVRAEDKAGDVMIDKYLAQEAAKLGERFLDGARTLDEWQAKRPRLKQEYLDMLGLWPLPEKTPLHATVTGTLERDDFVVEKLHFQSRPGLYVTGNLYRPKNMKGKLPTVLYVCGHSGRGRDGNKTAFQDHGMWFATHGYVCLVIDTLQLGEIPGIHHGTYSEGRWWWQARGYTPAGVECWNGIRAIDYLVSRPDVDPDRLAVTGISGGGAATFWIAAADERVRCAVPVSGMSDLESYVTHKVINGHCDCMFLINTYQWEWTTIAALIAPRPLLFCNSDKDSIFPMDGNERIIARLRKLYGMYGKPDLVNDHVSHGGHDYRPDLRIAVFQWINKHLKNDSGAVEDADFQPILGKKLRVFPEERDIPTDAINGKIDETFVPMAQVKPPEPGHFEEWKKGLMKELREKSFRVFPPRIPEAAACQLGVDELSLCELCSTEPGIRVRYEHHDPKDPPWSTLVIASATGDNYVKDYLKDQDDFIRHVGGGLLTLRGLPPNQWTRKSPPNYVERAHALLGRAADEGRVWDIAAIVRHKLRETKGKMKWRVIGRGQNGVMAAYAALFEPAIEEVVILDPPASHRDGPIFLNVLRVLDIPEALGMLAPKSLVLVNAKHRAFDRTAAIYKSAGVADNFKRLEEK
jgi:dienelactone hydrolase